MTTSPKAFVRRVLKRVLMEGRALWLRIPDRVECNVCRWSGRSLLDDSWHRNVCCPRCGSSVRHRMLAAAFESPGRWNKETLFRGKRVLHFAPEAFIGSLVAPLAAAYVTADFLHEGVDLTVDMTRMPSVGTGTFDVVIACDVLEHVSNFHQALAELHRVLSTDGVAILTVPQKTGLAKTYEDSSLTSAHERMQAFGQHDHLRIFGDDFPAELAAAGFEVDVMRGLDFPPSLVSRHCLTPAAPSAHPLATNERRLFFCRRLRLHD
jgi:SAM-dependent methyltransferase